MRKINLLAGLSALSLLVSAGPASARADGASAVRSAPDMVLVSWTASGPVDLYAADKPDATIATAQMVSAYDGDGHQEVKVERQSRPYFLIRDRSDGAVTEVAERLVPLEQGSNFRDIGGYVGADGLRVRWGLIYRSGASPLLNEDDLAKVQALGLRNLVDLRSNEERLLAPTRIDGVPQITVGYSMTRMFPASGTAPPRNGVALYHGLPAALAPQMRVLFDILKRGQAPVAYNCSAGQDRTGFATAMVLSALGVPRETIVKDYQLSTEYRQPQFEMPHIDIAAHPGNPAAQLFAHYQANPAKAAPLIEADGTPFLKGAFDEIDTRWGSVDAYLAQEAGVSAQDLAELRKNYLE